jgi:hypothetical protein
VAAAKVQEGIVITYPSAGDLATSTIAYAAAKKRYFSELRSAVPILITIRRKEMPETSEVEKFRSTFRLLDWEEERRIAKTTAEMLEPFENDQAVPRPKKNSTRLKKLKRLLLRRALRGTIGSRTGR